MESSCIVRSIATGLLTLSLASAPLASQTVPVTGVADCAPCSAIAFTRIGSVAGNADDPVLLHWLGIPKRLANGGWVSSGGFEPGVVAVYDDDGRFSHSFGRQGGGPGEFSGPTSALRGPLGFVWLHDRGNGRVTVLGPEGDVVTAFPFHGFIGYTAPVDSTRVLAIGTLQDSNGAILSGRFHLLDNNGRILRTFGTTPMAREAQRVFMTEDSTVLAPHGDAYVLQEWSLSGQHVATYARDLRWFEPVSPGQLNPPALLSASVDSAGLVWSVLKKPTTGSPPTQLRSFDDVAALAAGVVEVIDRDRATVIARGEFQHPYLFPIIPFDRHFLVPAEGPNGIVRFEIWRADMEQP